jgi:hypothetical protein
MNMKLTNTSRFIAMPLSAQALYFHLISKTNEYDDIVESLPIIRMIGANPDDLKILEDKGFIETIEPGVIKILK